MKAEHGFDLPRRMQIEFSKTIQHITEDSGTEITPGRDVGGVPGRVPARPAALRARRPRAAHPRRTGDGHRAGASSTASTTRCAARAADRSRRSSRACATSSPPTLDVVDYAEHAIGRGAEATAAAYVETIAGDDGESLVGHRHRSRHHDGRAQGGARRTRAPAALTARRRHRRWRTDGRARLRSGGMLRRWFRRLTRLALLTVAVGAVIAVRQLAARRRGAPELGPPATWPPLERGEPPVARGRRSRRCDYATVAMTRRRERRARAPSVTRRRGSGRRRRRGWRRSTAPARSPTRSRPTPTPASTTSPAGASTTARRPERCYADPAAAEADGYRAAKGS